MLTTSFRGEGELHRRRATSCSFIKYVHEQLREPVSIVSRVPWKSD